MDCMPAYEIELVRETYLDPGDIDPFLVGNVPEKVPQLKFQMSLENDIEARKVAKELAEKLNDKIQNRGGIISWYGIRAIYRQIA